MVGDGQKVRTDGMDDATSSGDSNVHFNYFYFTGSNHWNSIPESAKFQTKQKNI